MSRLSPNKLPRLAAAAFFTLVVASPLTALEETQKLVASDGLREDHYGTALAIDGAIAVIGAGDAFWRNASSVLVPRVGRAYVLRRDSGEWREDAILQPPFFGRQNGKFGNSVAIQGDTIAVGEPSPGQVTIYGPEAGGWVRQGLPFRGDDLPIRGFGASLDLDGNSIVVGAVEQFVNSFPEDNDGAVYWFTRTNDGQWLQRQKIVPDGSEPINQFGTAIALSGPKMIVGTRELTALIYRLDGHTWVEEARLVSPGAPEVDEFGHAVAMDGDVVVVGAHLDNHRMGTYGAAYVFRHDGAEWALEATLTAPDPSRFDKFGYSVAISGDTIVVGSRDHDEGKNATGAAFVFRYDGIEWSLAERLFASDRGPAATLGWAAAVDDSTAFVGARGGDAYYEKAGAVYAYDVGLPDIEYELDIEPFEDPNRIDFVEGNDTVVALLGSESFDVLDIDTVTLGFGPNEVPPRVDPSGSIKDVNHDGFDDLVVMFPTTTAGLMVGDTEACVVGRTRNGIAFESCDDVVIHAEFCGLGAELVAIVPGLLWLRLRTHRRQSG